MSAKKKTPAGVWACCLTAVLAIVSFVMYTMNVSGAGYFKDAAVSAVPMYCGLAFVALLAAIVLSMVKVQGIAGKLVELVIGAAQIAAPVLLSLALINLVAGRVEGLGFIFFSNADVALEVQTPENLASANLAIYSMVAFGVSAVVGMIAAFFNLKKD